MKELDRLPDKMTETTTKANWILIDILSVIEGLDWFLSGSKRIKRIKIVKKNSKSAMVR